MHKVTIIPRGMALGSTMQLPQRDKYNHRKKELVGMLAVLYGGRVAEELFCDDVSDGASNDISRATSLARSMVCSWGMSERLGPVALGEERQEVFLGDELVRSKNYSEATSQAIDAEVRSLLDGCYGRARDIIEAHRPEMEVLAQALLRYETVDGEDVEAVLAGASVDDLRPSSVPRHSTGPSDRSGPRPRTKGAEPDTDEGLTGRGLVPDPA